MLNITKFYTNTAFKKTTLSLMAALTLTTSCVKATEFHVEGDDHYNVLGTTKKPGNWTYVQKETNVTEGEKVNLRSGKKTRVKRIPTKNVNLVFIPVNDPVQGPSFQVFAVHQHTPSQSESPVASSSRKRTREEAELENEEPASKRLAYGSDEGGALTSTSHDEERSDGTSVHNGGMMLEVPSSIDSSWASRFNGFGAAVVSGVRSAARTLATRETLLEAGSVVASVTLLGHAAVAVDLGRIAANRAADFFLSENNAGLAKSAINGAFMGYTLGNGLRSLTTNALTKNVAPVVQAHQCPVPIAHEGPHSNWSGCVTVGRAPVLPDTVGEVVHNALTPSSSVAQEVSHYAPQLMLPSTTEVLAIAAPASTPMTSTVVPLVEACADESWWSKIGRFMQS